MIEQATLDRISFVQGLNAGARRELALRSVVRRFAPGEALWHAGMEASSPLVVLEGEVRVIRESGGRQHVIHTEGPGGTLGEVPLFEGGTYPATAIAARRTLCVAIGRDAIWAAVREDPELAFALLSRLAGRVRSRVSRLDGQVSRKVAARLAAFLIARHEASPSGSFVLGGTQQDVAEELGTVRRGREAGRSAAAPIVGNFPVPVARALSRRVALPRRALLRFVAGPIRVRGSAHRAADLRTVRIAQPALLGCLLSRGTLFRGSDPLADGILSLVRHPCLLGSVFAVAIGSRCPVHSACRRVGVLPRRASRARREPPQAQDLPHRTDASRKRRGAGCHTSGFRSVDEAELIGEFRPA